MKISAKKIASIKALEKLLTNFNESTELNNKEEKNLVVDLLRSQRKLATYENKELGIISSSLNTLKNHADLFLPDGYHGLNLLRNTALNKQQQLKIKPGDKNKTTKKGILLKLRESESDVEKLRQQNMQLVLLLQDLKRMSINYASKASSETLSLCKKEIQIINSKLSFIDSNE
jgi:hypothetical protein